MKGYVFISYGMGGAAIETWGSGERLLVERCKKLGLDTMNSPYQWSDVELICSQIERCPSDANIAAGGDSLGACEAPDIAMRIKQRIKRPIKYLFGFQSSVYGANVPVPSNVEFADNFYNPSWWQTFGLGYRQWTLAPGNKTTHLRNIPHYGPHPDDWGWTQDVVFSRIHTLLGASK